MDLLRPETSIKELIQKSVSGDEGAFLLLYEHLNDRLFAFIYARTRNRDDALDLLQEVFVDLWQALDGFSYSSDSEFYGFVFTITKRKLSKHYSATAKDAQRVDTADGLVMPDIDRLNNEQTLEAAMVHLKPMYREVLELRYWSELSFAEIAHILKTKETTVKVRHHRAVKQLQKILDTLES